VMDYPAPLIGIRADSTLDFSDAYATGIGTWDIQQIRYAYTQFAPGADEHAGLEAILRENREHGWIYVSDDDTRPAGAAHPLAAMWDNGADPVAGLTHELAVRRIALRAFGERNLPPGTPMSTLGEVLVPLYLHHRYALEAAAKSVGGLDYSYAVRGDGAPAATPVSPARQRAALAAVLGTLEPAVLDLPEPLLGRLLPPSVDYPAHREFFGTHTAPAFDALGAAASAADLTLATLLPPERLARLVDFHRRDPQQPGVDEVLDAITARAFATGDHDTPRLRELRRTVQAVTVRRLLAAASQPAQVTAVRAALESSLRRLSADLARVARGGESADQALRATLAADIRRWLDRPQSSGPLAVPGAPPELPAGPPIGGADSADECEWGTGVQR